MVQINYDSSANALYIRLQDDVVPVRGVEVDRGTLVDLADDDSVVGIEVLNPARAWPLDEIVSNFRVDDVADVLVLKAMWGGNGPYPYGVRTRTTRELVGAN